MNTLIKVIEAEEILTIIPLLTKLNSKTPLDILKERVIEISKNTNYECVGLYVDEKLVKEFFVLLFMKKAMIKPIIQK